MLKRLRRWFLIALAILASVLILVLAGGTSLFRGSLPRLEGDRELAGLIGTVSIERDSLGVPLIRADDRLDVSRALGYVHGQERFFQMDMLRRNAAGELSALLGPGLLDMDRDTRRHRFRTRATAVVAAMTDRQHALVDAYVAGVNAGLDDLRVRPFEYLLLRQQPIPWRAEDTILTICAMFLDLNRSTAGTEDDWGLVYDVVPPELARFLLGGDDSWSAPLQDDPLPINDLPHPAAVDLQTWHTDSLRTAVNLDFIPKHDLAGSNNWAVAGTLTGHGGALLANDMHLSHALPNIWYRAKLEWRDQGETRSVVGVTLPGTPGVIVGSNGHVAWGFTNSFGDWADLVILETADTDSTRYRTPDGWATLERMAEVIEVHGSEPDTLWIDESIWGPIWDHDIVGRPRALRWTAHDVDGVNVNLVDMENVDSIAEAIELAGSLGIPQQNLVCADNTGRIAWTIAGRVPRRFGWDGRLSTSWADGSCGWDGYLTPGTQPSIIDPTEGRIWTANNRVTAGADLAIIGDGGYGLGARARQIRDGLRDLDHPVETDMLAIQLDDRAVFLGEWRDLVLGMMARRDPAADGEHAHDRSQFEGLLTDHWDGHASVESIGYRLIRDTVFRLVDDIYYSMTGPAYMADSGFHAWELPDRRGIAWRLLTEQPLHMLSHRYESWTDLVLAAVDKTMEYVNTLDSAEEYTWGHFNEVQIKHPYTHFLPQLTRWLATESQPLPGDSHMPRVQHRSSGASERMVVSPGREEHGIMHMPGGQSGHPLSPFFLAGHEDWVEGRASPLLPGRAQYVLKLTPGSN
jgi:penicillin amidase